MRKSVRLERCGFRSSRRVLRFLTVVSRFTNHHGGYSVKNYYMQGFAPADESLLFRQKEPKPFSPVRGPAGASASVPNKMARELAPLKQPSPRGRFGTEAPPRPKARSHPRNKSEFYIGSRDAASNSWKGKDRQICMVIIEHPCKEMVVCRSA
jgi:hypothetical protein